MQIVSISHAPCSTRYLTTTPFAALECRECRKLIHPNSSRERISVKYIRPPYFDGHTASCCVVIKPTTGTFLSYKEGDNLHVGIADARRTVHSFSARGLVSERYWEESVVVHQFRLASFDEKLRDFKLQHALYFTRDGYREQRWNCFDFVIQFFLFVKLGRYSKCEFAELFVVKAIKPVLQYVALIKKIQRSGAVAIRE